RGRSDQSVDGRCDRDAIPQLGQGERPVVAFPPARRPRSTVILDDARPPSATRRPVAPLAPRRALAGTLTLASVFSTGAVRTREAPVHNATRDGVDRVSSNLGLSACANGVLSRHGLLGAALVDPEGAALRLEPALESRPGGEPDGPLA